MGSILDLLDARALLSAFGLAGMFVVLLAETRLWSGFFLPGDSVLFTAGLLTTVPASSGATVLPLPGVPLVAPAGGSSERRSAI